jgi:hypothetical protein
VRNGENEGDMDWVRNISNSRIYGFMNKRENVRQMTFDINC